MKRRQYYEITLAVAVVGDEEIQELINGVEHVACPYPVDASHPPTCPRPWFVITTRIRPHEWKEKWADLVNYEVMPATGE